MDLMQEGPIDVTDMTQVGVARRQMGTVAEAIGLDEAAAGRAALIMTEVATNLVKHAGGGEVVLQRFDDGTGDGVEILSVDHGRGMADVAECQRDGYSTSGSSGTGLGAIARLADFHDLYSQPGKGTVIMARLWRSRDAVKSVPRLDVGAVVAPKPGEEVSGDAWVLCRRQAGGTLLVADGLGHGPLAAAASQEATRVFREWPESPAAAIKTVHAALRPTRGAAVAVCDVDCDRDLVSFAGIGNIAGAILANRASRSLVSYNGIVGQQVRTVREFTYPWPTDGVLVLHSDGLASHWTLDGYPGLGARHPGLIAGVLYRDFARRRDDAVVVVAKRRVP
jgi:anti-sigma regulatory factor (Ser/Thr protein kinase)